ncbi:MAG: hypothetical protein ACQEQG_02805 [Bacillota bacterium]
MADKVYYKIQYPLKKAIQMLKAIPGDEEEIKQQISNLSEQEKGIIKDFLIMWDDEGEVKLEKFIQKLKYKLD